MSDSTYQDGAAVDVEDFAGDEAGEGSAQEEDGAGELVDVRGAAEGDGGHHFFRRFGVVEGSGGHLGGDPAGGYAVAVDSGGDELGGEALGEGDKGAFAGGVVGVEGFAALGCGGGDEDDVAAGAGVMGLRLHLGHGGLDEAEDAVEVDAESGAPLAGGHGGDGGVVGGPDAVVDDEAV